MINPVQAEAGHFYAIGTGPGAPDLLTIRAANLIRAAQVIIAPRSEKAEESLVMRSIRDLVSNQEVVTHTYPMQRDLAKTIQSWEPVADLVAARCRDGKVVVQATIGDPLLYSTSSYLLPLLAERMPAERLHVVPGICAFQAVASRLGLPLALQEDRVLIMPATDLQEVERALERCETLVLYKSGRHLRGLADLLDRKGLAGKAHLICNAEQGEREFSTTDLRLAADGQYGYLATVIIQVGRRGWFQPESAPAP
jgi:precorrin-2/cobalt-factor-2 C20-methyltransferase